MRKLLSLAVTLSNITSVKAQTGSEESEFKINMTAYFSLVGMTASFLSILLNLIENNETPCESLIKATTLFSVCAELLMLGSAMNDLGQGKIEQTTAILASASFLTSTAALWMYRRRPNVEIEEVGEPEELEEDANSYSELSITGNEIVEAQINAL